MDDDFYVEITVLAKGNTLSYIVPSFPVFKVALQEVKLQWEERGDKTHVFDGFARQCALLDHPLPAVAKIMFSYENAFIIEVLLIPYLLKYTCIFVHYRERNLIGVSISTDTNCMKVIKCLLCGIGLG